MHTPASWHAIGLSALVGARTLGPPAMVVWRLGRWQPGPDRWLLHQLRRPAARGLVSAAALGELLADKLPFTPDRVSSSSLAGRLVSGAGTAVILAQLSRREVVPAALLGGLAAGLGAFATFHLRRQVSRASGLPNPLLGLAEDLLVAAAADWLLGAAEAASTR